MKICINCKSEKAETEFYASHRFKDGYRRWCKQCDRAAALKWRNANRDRALESLYKWKAQNVQYEKQYRSKKYWANPEVARERTRTWTRDNAARMKLTRRAYRLRHPDRNQEYARRWARKNPGRVRVYLRSRKIGERRATPSWANLFFMGEIYDLARLRTQMLGVPHEVDHVVPIKHKLVCGLHCHLNLQVVPASTNRTKGNKWWPDMPQVINDNARPTNEHRSQVQRLEGDRRQSEVSARAIRR